METAILTSEERPRQIGTAISLISLNVFLVNLPRTASVFLGVMSGRIASDDVVFKIIDEFVIWGFSLGLLALVWSGANWARWLNLVLAIANFVLMTVRAVALISHRSPAVILPASYVVIESAAQYLLFFSPGKIWFQRTDAQAAA